MFQWAPRIAVADDDSVAPPPSEVSEEYIDLKGDQFKPSPAAKKLNLAYPDLWALALTTAVGNHFSMNWSVGLTAGFGSYTVGMVLAAAAYLCLMLSLSELASALPFAGGAYGIARVTLGIFPGYFVACMDTMKSVMYVIAAVASIGRTITFATGASRHLEPVYWLIFYAVSVGVNICGDRMLWYCVNGLAVTCVLLLVVFVLGASPFANLAENAPLNDETNTSYEQWLHGGMYEFMHALPMSCNFYVGIQSLNLACGELLKPKTEVPKAYIATMTTVLCSSFVVLLTACSVAPGVQEVMTSIHPLSRGYMKMFAISDQQAALISLPGIISAAFGFMYMSGHQLRAMGMSGLLNPVFAKELPGRGTPVGALVISSVFGYGLCLLTFYLPETKKFTYHIGMMGAYVTYVSIMLSFYIFRNHYPTITREFVSPLGIGGAVYGFLVFLLSMVAICAFQHDQVPVTTFAVLSAIFTVYYFLVVEKRQTFSEEEKTVLFKAYLVKGNAARNHRIRIRKGRELAIANTNGHGVKSPQAIPVPSVGASSVTATTTSGGGAVLTCAPTERNLDGRSRDGSLDQMVWSVSEDEMGSSVV